MITKFQAYLLTEKRVSANTFDAYKRDMNQYETYLNQKKIQLKKVQLKDIKSFLKYLKEDLGIGARSMSRKISCLKTFYTYMHNHHGWKNVAQDLTLPKIEKKLPQYLSEKEVEQLLQVTDDDPSDIGVRNKVMVYLLYVSGMRISEMVNLKKSDIQFDTGFLTVAGKGGKGRMVPLPQTMLDLLTEYIEDIHPRLLSDKTTDYLFPIFYEGKIKPISRQSFWKILHRLAKSCGISQMVSPHKLRHSLATHLLKKGADLRSLQLLLGHEQLETVQIYTHLDTTYLRSIYDKKHPRS